MFKIFNKSILNLNEILEKNLNLDKNKDYYILYEGEIIKGKNIKNGKGIEYRINKDNIIFDGEYLNGERWKGKEYNYEGELIFEGRYLYNFRRKGKKYIKGK